MRGERNNHPDYGFENGIVARDFRDIAKDPKEPGYQVATRAQLDRITGSVTPEIMREVYDRTRQPELIFSKDRKSHLAVASVGPDDAEKTVAIFPGWGGHAHGDVAMFEQAAFLAENPDIRQLYFNLPGAGYSSEIPDNIKQECIRRGNYSPIAEVFFDQIQDLLSDSDRSILAGHSTGGILTTDILRLADEPIADKALILDSLVTKDFGIEKSEKIIGKKAARYFGLIGLGAAFFVVENGHKKHYNAVEDMRVNPELLKEIEERIAEVMIEPKEYSSTPQEIGTRANLKHLLLFDPFILSRGKDHSLEGISKGVREDVVVMLPEFSGLNDQSAVSDELVGALNESDGDKIKLMQIAGHSHSIQDDGRGAVSTIARDDKFWNWTSLI